MAWPRLMRCWESLFLLGSLLLVNLMAVYGDAVNLPNAPCELREALIAVDSASYKYRPLIVSLNRCGGACGWLPPTVKSCKASSVETIALNALNTVTYQNETVLLSNHTACRCECVYDASVCDPVTQYWDDNNCKCKCKRDATQHACPPNYIWDPNTCRCICNAMCNDRQDFNATACTCECRSKYYKRCSRKGKILHEDDCRCYNAAGSYTGLQGPCNSLPTKWAAVVVLVSMIAFCVLAFDCFLLTKKTGVIYVLASCCRQKDERISQKSTESFDQGDTGSAGDRHPLIERSIST